MSTEGFIFDYAKCVGCHACMVACYVENKIEPSIAWRQVNTINSKRIPLAGFLNLSLACNHCVEAPCLKACPAKAYIKDEHTGAIIHQPEKCIGCRYCTWACPFDAPKYNENHGIVEKCNLCNHLVSKGLKPSCAKQCPTGALSFSSLDKIQNSYPVGIPATNYQPRIKTLRSEIIEAIPQLDISITGFEKIEYESQKITSSAKIQAKNEWPLVFFTLIFAFLSGWIYAFDLEGSIVLKSIFVATGVLGILLSTFHLGKPFRAWHSITNLRTSWLSREILFCVLFFFSSILYLFLFHSKFMLVTTSVLNLLLLISIEMVYSVPKKNYTTPLHSSNTILTALMFALLYNGLLKLLVALIVIKALLYIVRKGTQPILTLSIILVFIRVFGLILSIGIISLTNDNSLLLLFSLITSEVIDRYEFYNDIYVDTPLKILEKLDNDAVMKWLNKD
ncbi:MAG: dimethyl sulfoxide reductase anchor subunit [Bacteroidales bacterium]|nr:dimethyl sulfoxide reductase anchor subunit [Bacteroidales bacterium]